MNEADTNTSSATCLDVKLLSATRCRIRIFPNWPIFFIYGKSRTLWKELLSVYCEKKWVYGKF